MATEMRRRSSSLEREKHDLEQLVGAPQPGKATAGSSESHVGRTFGKLGALMMVSVLFGAAANSFTRDGGDDSQARSLLISNDSLQEEVETFALDDNNEDLKEDDSVQGRELAGVCQKYRKRALCNSKKAQGCFWKNSKNRCMYSSNLIGGPGVDGFLPVVSACLANPDNCPTYPEGTLRKEWPVINTDAANCLNERRETPDACTEICFTLFGKYTSSEPWGIKVSSACQVGCAYAKLSWAGNPKRNPDTCMFDCKNTVWLKKNGAKKCNYDIGLGISVFEIPDFGAGKACELGCIIGNDRPCVQCDAMSYGR